MQPSENPDLILAMYHLSTGKHLLDNAARAGVKVLTVNTQVPEEETGSAGAPREKHTNWIGAVSPDDEQVGYDLAMSLFAAARAAGKQDADGMIHALALSGKRDSTAALLRNKGLMRAVAESPDVQLNQLFWTNWDASFTKEALPVLLRRFPHTSVIWGVYDGAALGALAPIRQIGKEPGKDIFIGGVDCSIEGLKAVKDGTMLATYGMHFMDGAWSLVLAYDYFHGKDFKQSVGTEYNTEMLKVDASNVDRYLELMERMDWSQIDFKQLTRTNNPDRAGYDFSLETILPRAK